MQINPRGSVRIPLSVGSLPGSPNLAFKPLGPIGGIFNETFGFIMSYAMEVVEQGEASESKQHGCGWAQL